MQTMEVAGKCAIGITLGYALANELSKYKNAYTGQSTE
tara:strand:- start:9389 stop:9502 length:114 start_codon:yes stop_codon:yes gene_type:complete